MEKFTVKTGGHLVLRKGARVLLLRRANTGWDDGKFALVAGHLEEGETLRESMVREAREEIGIRLRPDSLRVVHVMHKTGRMHMGEDYVVLFFEARRWSGRVRNMEPDKCSGIGWFSIRRLPKNTSPLERQALGSIRKGVIYSEYGFG
ncbi:MAG: NUDIX domain-containing protein [Candidatus Marsarchaeota archaeon]|nr:NUDIX domain-containing protein [Candidatus Marsarchaeota archaeon]